MLPRSLKFLASLKLAVLVLISLAVIIAVGTIIEAQYDATVAKAWVYNTWYMYAVMGILAINLLAVMVDRLPWQTRHYPFVFAHIGIIILLVGAWVTLQFGLDGIMRIPIGSVEKMITLPDTQVSVYATFNGQDFTRLFEKTVNFFSMDLEKKPIEVLTDSGLLRFKKFIPFAQADRKIVSSDNPLAGTAIRFQISNSKFNTTDWILQAKTSEPSVKDFGPVKIILTNVLAKQTKNNNGNEIYLYTNKNEKSKELYFDYILYSRNQDKPTLKGKVSEGGVIHTPWMNLDLKLLRVYEHAEEKWDFKSLSRPSSVSTSALEFEFQGKTHTLQMDDVVKLFTEKASYFVGFGRRRVDIGFSVKLNHFEIGRYQGTMMASNYKSMVEVHQKQYTISMNEPLKYNGLMFYQASFDQDPSSGAPTASVLSVNSDPGRFLKYLGSLLLTIGSVWLIYNKRKSARALGPKPTEEVSL